MDKLLANKPRQLNDERKELFALIDRFANSIREYQGGYAQLIKKAKDDISDREKQKVQALKAMSDRHNSEKSKVEVEHAGKLKTLNKRIEEEKTQATKKIEDLENKCRDSISNEQSILNGQKNSNDRKIKDYRNILAEIERSITRVKTIMGDTFTGESKFDKVSKSIKLKNSSVGDSKVALSYLSKDSIYSAERLTGIVREITESLPKKIIFNKKRTAAIKELLELKNNVETSIRILEREVRSAQGARDKVFEQKTRSIRESSNRNKQDVIESRDRNVKALRTEIDKENGIYTNKLQSLITKQKKEYDELKNHHESQIVTATNNWKSQIQQYNNAFVKKMDEDYPADRMNAWLKQFWYHPRNVEQYKVICDEINLNVLIGMAQIDISDWVTGPTAKVVGGVLLKYALLFGLNKEEANESLKRKIIRLPYTISIENGDSILFSHDEASGERANDILNSVAMRMLNSVSACMMRFILFDEVGYGSFKELKSIDPAEFNTQRMMVKSIIYGEGKNESEMSSLLSELDNSFSRIEGQRSNYSSIREFNQNNPLSKKNYQPILMSNYPSGLKIEGFKILSKIVSNCSKWGGTVFLAQPDNLTGSIKPELLSAKSELDKKLLIFRIENGRKELTISNSSSLCEKKAKIFFYGLPDKDTRMNDIAPDLRKRSVEASKVKINLTDAGDIYLPKEKWFNENSDYGISVPIGYEENGIPYELQFDDAHVNAIITGRTGSGKSNLVHALIMGTLMRYSPEEVKIYLIDFKNATDYSVYAKRYYLPSFASISLADDPEFALSILESIEKEVKNRSSVISDSDTKKIGTSTNRKLCRILLIIDELYVLAEKASDELRKQIMDKIDTLTHQTRAYGIHTIVCGQDLNKLERYDTIMEQCATRIALHCSDEQVQGLFGDDGITTMHSIDSDDRGTAVFSSDGGKTSGKERTVLVEDDKQLQILSDISDYYLNEGRLDKTIIVHSKIKDNPNNPLQLFVSHGTPQYEGICIGEPIILGGSNTISPLGNVWVAGGNVSENSYHAAQSVTFFSLYSILLNKIKNGNVTILCSNCADQQTRNIEDEEKDLFGQLSVSYPNLFNYDKGEGLYKTLDLILDEVDKRKSDAQRCKNEVWWFVVRPEMINNLSQTFVTDFKELLSAGPKVNIRVVLWNYDVKQAQELQINRNMFSERICLEMNSDDMRAVNGTELKPAPNGYKVSVVGANTIRFRAFDLPEGLWMNQLFERLNLIANGR